MHGHVYLHVYALQNAKMNIRTYAQCRLRILRGLIWNDTFLCFCFEQVWFSTKFNAVVNIEADTRRHFMQMSECPFLRDKYKPYNNHVFVKSGLMQMNKISLQVSLIKIYYM